MDAVEMEIESDKINRQRYSIANCEFDENDSSVDTNVPSNHLS